MQLNHAYIRGNGPIQRYWIIEIFEVVFLVFWKIFEKLANQITPLKYLKINQSDYTIKIFEN